MIVKKIQSTPSVAVKFPLKLKIDGSWRLKVNELRIKHENEIRTEENETNIGYIIETDVSYDEFIKGVDKLLGDAKVRVFFINGNVLIYEFVQRLHERTSNWISGEIYHNQNVHDTCSVDGSLRINLNIGTALIPNKISYEPDQSITPNGRGPPLMVDNSPFPTLVVEVGYSQSPQSLHTKALHYLNPLSNIQLVICVKIWSRNPANQNFRALMMFYRRGFAGTNPEQIISFGTSPLHHETRNTLNGWNLPVNQITGFGVTINGVPTPACNQAGMAQYILQIPSAELYNGVAGGVPNGVPANIPLDLFNLQTKINDIQTF
ncbi:hypothetical protein DLAC_05974 [Tieghemostelium lacteum]|uniref:Restriction endonuclease domain-containing protein n=1 Tax=Tieghemostelium lacteum TaxID=361077 RepID=A0A151ZH46_TIELA|nr:hypothetical protein DLAC_05974 [Tieghemostelium lacteum]|eukprot:KYQ93308.1 hypothetical protein DLAC_05974 [Tieghemostelium lacteum]